MPRKLWFHANRSKKPNALVNWQQRAQHVDVQLNAELGAG